MAILTKQLNKLGYKEAIVSKELFNLGSMYADGVLVENDVEKGWVSSSNMVLKKVMSCYLGRDLTEEDTVQLDDTETKSRNKANGYYSSVFKKLFPNTEIPKSAYGEEKPILDSNRKTDNVFIEKAYCYDLNSAYLSVLKDGKYPDVDKGDLGFGMVEAEQIGFVCINGFDDKGREQKIITEIKYEGEWAEHRFVMSYSQPLYDWVHRTYDRLCQYKKEGKKYEAGIEKLAIVKSIGVLRNHNVWFHSYIVRKISRFMRENLDEYSILWNTDSIISLTKREDLQIGSGLGEFKLEFDGCPMRHIGVNYAWRDSDGIYHAKSRGEKEGEKEENQAYAKRFLEIGKAEAGRRFVPDYKVIKLNQGVKII